MKKSRFTEEQIIGFIKQAYATSTAKLRSEALALQARCAPHVPGRTGCAQAMEHEVR